MQKNKKMSQWKLSKKSFEVSFVSSGMEKSTSFSVFLPLWGAPYSSPILVGLMHNITTAEGQKNAKLQS